jgi:site-specific DNA-methyltransferase (adenine-specific)
MKITDKITITNEDNMLLMDRYPDNYFDLAIVDPPYRNMDENQPTKDMRNNGTMSNFGDKPTKYFFNELFRVSKNQIIWGANNFNDLLSNNKGFVIYKKKTITDKFTMSMCEYAWINNELSTVSKCFEHIPQDKNRIHPTQKPTNLYKWLLDMYAKENDKILDTHLGSGSIAIACHDYGYELTACELDKEYYDKAIERIVNHTKQIKLF